MSDYKAGVARRFDRAAGTYDRHAQVQNLMSERLIARVESGGHRFARILELGCGTGALTARLAEVFPAAGVTALDLSPEMVAVARARPAVERVRFQVADAETVALPGGAFDLVVSSATIQWLERPAETLRRLASSLAPGGLMLHATFGPATFRELREVLDSIEGPRPRGLHLAPAQAWESMIAAGGLGDTGSRRELLIRHYPGLTGLLRSMKGIGASFVPEGAGEPWQRYRILKEAIRIYDRRFATPAGVQVTYELLELAGTRNIPPAPGVGAC